jgi:hypothetical protein
VTQPKVSALRRYKLEGFSVERLMNLLTALDQDVEIVIRRKPARGRLGGSASSPAIGHDSRRGEHRGLPVIVAEAGRRCGLPSTTAIIELAKADASPRAVRERAQVLRLAAVFVLRIRIELGEAEGEPAERVRNVSSDQIRELEIPTS